MTRKVLISIAVIVGAVGLTITLTDRAPARIDPPEPPSVPAVAATSSGVDGIVTSVGDNRLVVDVEGVTHEFVVPETCEIRKDRRPSELDALFSGDHVIVESAGPAEQPIATSIRAFGIM